MRDGNEPTVRHPVLLSTEGTFMQDNVLQPAMQPFIKLIQANMELMTNFSKSPEVISQSVANAQNLFQQGQGSATNLVQSNAFAQLMQGMLKNYTEFMMELGQSGMAVLAQSQAAMMRGAQDVSENVVDASEARGRRTRQAA
jgi:putative cell wall-binding protein